MLSRLPNHVVGTHIAKHLSAKNMASLVGAGKVNGATSHLRNNLKEQKKIRTNLENSHLNLYKWMNFLKTIPKTRTNNITNDNISQIQNSIVKQNMERQNRRNNIFSTLTDRFHNGTAKNRSPIMFPTKNGSTWLSVGLSKYYNHNRYQFKGGPVTIYIKKKQGDKIFVYRVIHPVVQKNYSLENDAPWNWSKKSFNNMRSKIGNPNTTTLPLFSHQKKNVSGLLQKLFEEKQKPSRKKK